MEIICWHPISCSLPSLVFLPPCLSFTCLFPSGGQWGLCTFTPFPSWLSWVLEGDKIFRSWGMWVLEWPTPGLVVVGYWTKVKVRVAQSCLTLRDPMDCAVHGILQARILEWVAFPFSRGLPNQVIESWSSTLYADSLLAEPQGMLDKWLKFFDPQCLTCKMGRLCMCVGKPVQGIKWEVFSAHTLVLGGKLAGGVSLGTRRGRGGEVDKREWWGLWLTRYVKSSWLVTWDCVLLSEAEHLALGGWNPFIFVYRLFKSKSTIWFCQFAASQRHSLTGSCCCF